MRTELAPACCLASVLATLLATAGCTVGPDYARPEVPVPAHYRFGTDADRAAADTAWWEGFGDPALAALVKEALANNRDIDAAAGRVEQFYGSLRSSRSALFPQVGAAAGGSRTLASQKVPGVPAPNPYSTWQADLFASWEIDLFGKIRRLNEAARADLLASEEARQGVILAVVAGVVDGYIALREADRELEVSRRTLASRADSLDLFEKRFKGGVISELELNQARSEYANALKSVPDSEQRIAQDEDALSVLVGRNPGPIERGHAIDELTPPAVPAGLPSDLLERRPDVRQAEQALISANAHIGAAKALYYPSISLTGLFGVASTSLSDLWSGPAKTWSYAGQLTVPIFTAGSIAGQVQTAEGARREAQANYRKAIQLAFQDTEDALVGVAKSAQSLDAQQLEVQSLGVYARMARLRYEGGYTSYIEVLDAERSLFAAEILLAQTQAAALNEHVALYKALGGGWVGLADQGAQQPVVKVGETPTPFP
jgi:multidrug efflux system outer membrane protein